MLLFSEYLRELLQTKQVTISALARAVGVERSTLSKVLTGQRVLPYDALAAVAYHLRLTPGEAQQLRAYYDAQFEKRGHSPFAGDGEPLVRRYGRDGFFGADV